MRRRATGPYAHPLSNELPRGVLGWSFVSLSLHGAFLTALLVLLPSGTREEESAARAQATFRRPRAAYAVAEYEIEFEESAGVHEQEIVGEEPVIRDEAIADSVLTDSDLPHIGFASANAGIGGALSDAPFEGPAHNGTLGLGGGAGGAFCGRGGSRDLGVGGGGARRGGGWQKCGKAEDDVHRARPCFRREGYDRIRDNPFRRAREEDTSTFSIDVDTASYAIVRRFLSKARRLPPKDAVRIEELINYFPYGYEPPREGSPVPFRAHAQVADCPWNPRHRLARIAVQGRVLSRAGRPAANLVFLVDVSGSMQPDDKLPLLKTALARLVPRLEARDRVSIVVYAGAAGVVLPPVAGNEHRRILDALDQLRSGGSTNGGAGIELAYQLATQNFIEGGVNRVLLATDGDFNVGVSSRGELTRLIEAKARTGVFLSVLGFGTGNLKDDRMEELSNKGNGNYAYIDSLREAHKVLVEQASGTLVTIAKDVKIQVFFNPARVAGFRLIGYENRMLARQDFNDDTKDAGEIGAGHAVTALYEIVPAGTALSGPGVDPNPFVRPRVPQPASGRNAPLFRLRLRYKAPDGVASALLEQDVFDAGQDLHQSDRAFQWAAAVAAFGMLLRDSEHKAEATWDGVLEMARAAVGSDPGGYRKEFVALVERAHRLALAERG